MKGKRATVFYSERDRLRAQGARYVRKPVVVDGLIVTGSGPDAADQFTETLKQLILKQVEKRHEEVLKEAQLNSAGGVRAGDEASKTN